MLVDRGALTPTLHGHQPQRKSPMKAVLCKAFGPAETLVLEEIASPEAKKNEVLLSAT